MAKQTITAFFDSREYANNAALMLRQAGIPESDVTLSPDTTVRDYSTDRPATGFWASLEEMFGGSDDHGTYREGLRRGGVMLVAHVDDIQVDEAVRILEEHGSVDLDERETAWRSEGWTGETSTTGAAAPGGTAGTLGTETTQRSALSEMGTRPAVATEAAASGTGSVRAGKDDVLQVVEESLDIGKRAVNRGKVRIHSYVVEKPVSESVTLRDETVRVDRRPVDRPASVADLGADAFKERTIEMDEVGEEAVVAKTARVVEEIGIRKDATDRVQTVTDTVRSTKVDVEDARQDGSRSERAGGFGGEIANDLEVVGSDGQHVGTVDHLDGPNIKLKRLDPASGGTHHLIPTDWVAGVDSKVTLKVPAADAKSRWLAA